MLITILDSIWLNFLDGGAYVTDLILDIPEESPLWNCRVMGNRICGKV